MWKPGTAKPAPTAPSPKTPSHNNNNNNNEPPNTNNGIMEGNTPQKSPASSAKKRLTGATMNMRFMKRKKETQEFESKRKQQPNSRSPAASSSPKPVAAAAEFDDDPMDISMVDDAEEEEPFSRATPDDMYGMQSLLIGRRSFGGFNPAMQEAWKDAKASLENELSEGGKSKQKVSDEELLQRYQDLVQKRSESSRPVGNLNKDKANRKKRR